MERENFDLLVQFQQAVGKPEAWLAAFSNLARSFSADHAHLVGKLGPHKMTPVFQTVGLDTADANRFRSDRACELWGPLELWIPEGRLALQNEIISDQNFERSDYYNDIVRPTGGFYSCTYREKKNAEPLQFLLCRNKSRGAFDEFDRDRLGRLTHYVAATYNLHRRLTSTEMQNARLSSAMNLLEEGVIITDRKGRLQFANERATHLLGQADTWFATARVEDLNTSKPAQKLADTVAESLATDLPVQRRLVTSGTKGAKGVFLIHLTSLSSAELTQDSAGGLILFIRPASEKFRFDRQALMHLHGLSMRESEIAEGIACGNTVMNIAEQTGLTEGTVRFYLKQIFGKLGVNNQTALAAVLQAYRHPEL